MASIAENRSSLKEFLASIATIRGDLSNITAPPFVLATQSAVEFPAYWAEHPAIFVAPAKESDPQRRALLVLKWFLAALKQQQYAGRDEKDGIKKPLNAFLGELFMASFEGGSGANGTTRLVSEQVSHHPPVTACYLWNDEHGIRAEGYTRQEITFNGFVNVKQVGHAILHIDAYNEDYLIPLPNVKVKGLLTGTPYPELNGTYYISSSSGFIAEIDFSGLGFLGISGKKNQFEARLYRADDAEKRALYTAKGAWNGIFTITDATTNTDLETYDTRAEPAAPLLVEPVAEQDPWESRRAWKGVIDALNRGDMQATSDEKGKIENGQRAMRKREKQQQQQQQAGKAPELDAQSWEPTFFRREEGDAVFDRLAKPVRAELGKDKTVGVWKFDKVKAGRAKKPYRGHLTPTG